MISVNGNIIPIGTFPDKTLLMKVDPTNGQYLIEWRYEGDHELFALICLSKHLRGNQILQMSYIPHARQDRVKYSDDVFTLKYFCEVINSLNFDEVRVADAHSNVSLALLERAVSLPVKPTIEKVISQIGSNNLIAFYPDEGAMKRYSGESSLPYAFGLKNRSWVTGKISGLTLINEELVKGKDVLIIDDICSRGGTFYYSAKALKEAGANHIYMFVTHCEETIFSGEVFSSGLIDHVYTTHSIFKEEWQNGLITII